MALRPAEASAAPSGGVRPASIIRKLPTGKAASPTVLLVWIGENASSAARSAESFRKSLAPSSDARAEAHTRGDADEACVTAPLGECRNRDSAARNAAASS